MDISFIYYWSESLFTNTSAFASFASMSTRRKEMPERISGYRRRFRSRTTGVIFEKMHF